MQRIFSSPDPKGHVIMRAIVSVVRKVLQTTGPIETKLGRNFHWMVPFKVYVFCC